MALSVESVSNFRRDGSRPTAFDVQALIANHFVLLWWKHHGSERQLKASRKVGKVSGKETNESKPTEKNPVLLSVGCAVYRRRDLVTGSSEEREKQASDVKRKYQALTRGGRK